MVSYLYEAFPKIINAQDYSNTASDTIQTLQVEFAFHHWARDEEVYDNTQRFGSRNEDEGKPKRTTLAGYENMTYEQAQEFLRQNSIETLNADAGGSPAHAQLLKGAGSIDMGAASTKMAGMFKGYNQAVGTLPLSSRKGVGLAVEAETVPAQQKLADPVKTPYSYFDGAPRPGGSKVNAETMYGRETEVTVFGDAVAWKSSPTGKKYAPTTTEKAPLAGCVLGMPNSSASGNKTTAEEPVSTLFCRPQRKKDVAVQTKPDGSSVAAKVPASRAAAWVNPNTGQSVGGGSSAGAQMKSGLASVRRALPYFGAVASTSTGIARQAVNIQFGTANFNIKATVSLGGGGGGSGNQRWPAPAAGAGPRLYSPTSRSGISIPLFGGIPALRGAGFQVRAVGSRGTSSRNHAPEGRSDAGERD